MSAMEILQQSMQWAARPVRTFALNCSLHRIGDDIHCVEVVVGQPGGYIQSEVVLYCLRRLAYAAAWARTRWLCYWDACKDGRALLRL